MSYQIVRDGDGRHYLAAPIRTKSPLPFILAGFLFTVIYVYLMMATYMMLGTGARGQAITEHLLAAAVLFGLTFQLPGLLFFFGATLRIRRNRRIDRQFVQPSRSAPRPRL